MTDSTTKGSVGLDDLVAILMGTVDQLKAELVPLQEREHEIEQEIHKLEEQLTELTVPYKVGDIVEDECQVRYRVTEVRRGYRSKPHVLFGIRLTVKGIEAHQNQRPIYSQKLHKVTI